MKNKNPRLAPERMRILLSERRLLLDGGIGTMIIASEVDDRDFTYEDSRGREILATGDYDLLNITSPGIIRRISECYAEAGANILTTNTFESNRIAQEAYGLENYAGEMARTGAKICREVAEAFESNNGRRIYVAGSVGPTSHVKAHGRSEKDYLEAYEEQIEALIAGGADIILIESIMNLENMESALKATENIMGRTSIELPIMVSAIPRDKDGRLYDGAKPEEFAAAAGRHKRVVSIGYNCGSGVENMEGPLSRLTTATGMPLSCHPNVGNCDNEGLCGDIESFCGKFSRLMERIPLRIAGGCCGTTPEHIRSLNDNIKNQ